MLENPADAGSLDVPLGFPFSSVPNSAQALQRTEQFGRYVILIRGTLEPDYPGYSMEQYFIKLPVTNKHVRKFQRVRRFC